MNILATLCPHSRTQTTMQFLAATPCYECLIDINITLIEYSIFHIKSIEST